MTAEAAVRRAAEHVAYVATEREPGRGWLMLHLHTAHNTPLEELDTSRTGLLDRHARQHAEYLAREVLAAVPVDDTTEEPR